MLIEPLEPIERPLSISGRSCPDGEKLRFFADGTVGAEADTREGGHTEEGLTATHQERAGWVNSVNRGWVDNVNADKVVRAKGVLLAAAGLDNQEIARRLSTTREVVSKWRKRFFE